jgi:hypothetical protein
MKPTPLVYKYILLYFILFAVLVCMAVLILNRLDLVDEVAVS